MWSQRGLARGEGASGIWREGLWCVRERRKRTRKWGTYFGGLWLARVWGQGHLTFPFWGPHLPNSSCRMTTHVFSSWLSFLSFREGPFLLTSFLAFLFFFHFHGQKYLPNHAVKCKDKTFIGRIGFHPHDNFYFTLMVKNLKLGRPVHLNLFISIVESNFNRCLKKEIFKGIPYIP